MKSSFLFTLLVTALTASVASAQMSTKPSSKELRPEQKSSFDKFYDRLKIGYFGILTTPTFEQMEKGDFTQGALSPEFSGGTNLDSWPTNIWSQLSFNYNYGGKLNFVFNPRFVINLAHADNMSAVEDPSLIMMEDFLVGFQGVVFSSVDKAFNFWIRPGVRLPTSQTSRNSGNRGAGTITHQLEFAYLPTYDFNKTWQIGVFGQLRQWVFEDVYDFTRFRIYNAPFIQYTINDTSKFQLYYQHIWETDRRDKPVGDRDPVFKDMWQDVFLGYAVDVTPKLNIMPTVAMFVNDAPITSNSFYLGAWISYTIK